MPIEHGTRTSYREGNISLRIVTECTTGHMIHLTATAPYECWWGTKIEIRELWSRNHRINSCIGIASASFLYLQRTGKGMYENTLASPDTHTHTHTHTRVCTITHWCWQSAIFEDWVLLPPRVFNWMSVRLAIISETKGKKKNALKDSCYLWCQLLCSVSNWQHWFERWKMFLFVKRVYLLPNKKRISYFPNQKRFIICYYSVYIQKYCKY